MVVPPPSFTPEERVESLKAGALSGAIAAAVTFGFGILHRGFAGVLNQAGTIFPPITDLLHLGVAILSGALFGITYRYVVRQNENPQLAAGAAGAFGLVRGLTQLEFGLGNQPLWALALLVGESILLFAIAQGALQTALRRRWIQPFGTDPP